MTGKGLPPHLPARRAARLLACLDRALASLETGAVGLCLFAGATLSFLLVTGRYFLNRSYSTFEELSVYLVIWMAFIGMVMADRGRQHISIDILHHMVSPARRAALFRVADLLQTVVCFLLAWFSVTEVLFSYAIAERSVSALEAPIWLIMAVMPPAFLLTGLRSLRRTLAPARERVSQKTGSSF